MRKRFEINLELGQTPIEEIKIPIKSRDEMPATLLGLQWIFKNINARERILDILESKVLKGKKQTGRTGMELWQILVLGVVRLSLDCDYDRLEYLVNYDILLRQMLGLDAKFGEDFGKRFHQKTICDNVKEIDEKILKEINKIVEEEGSELLLKKNEKIELKTDSYVLETNVHFPTDYNLLWDAARKSIHLSNQLSQNHEKCGWRKSKNWAKKLKGLVRNYGKVQKSGGKNKEARTKEAVKKYLNKAIDLEVKLQKFEYKLIEENKNIKEDKTFKDLQYFLGQLTKQIGLLNRRVLKGESIPHEEKIFSLFEEHTEWINKGKSGFGIELGHKVLVTTNQKSLIVDYKVMDQSSDMREIKDLKDRLASNPKREIISISVDKGFSSKENLEMLESIIPEVIMPKKGRRNQKEEEIERSKTFKMLKNRHSAIESNINCLEHHGLNRCPDKGLSGYKRYVGLGVLSYNLHKIGNYLLLCARKQKKKKPWYKQAA